MMNKLTMWLASTVVTLVLFVVAAYAKMVGDTLTKHDTRITDAAVELIHVEEDLAIVNSKMDLLLRSGRVRYEGPQFKSYADRHGADH